jgi:outer membrane protein
MNQLRYGGATTFLFFLLPFLSIAQPRIISVKEALSMVEAGQPQLQAWRERSAAAQQQVRMARNSGMPELTAAYQAGYATYNNITGMSYPGSFLPISGPPSAGNTYDPVPGTALSALLQWTPFTFGQRQAAVEKASAQYRLANSEYNEALFRQQYAAVNTYLEAVYLQKAEVSLRSNIERIRAVLVQSLVLAKEGLRPGIDTVQFQSALSQATMEQLNTTRLYEAQLLELARLTGLPQKPDSLLLSDTLPASQPPRFADTSRSYDAHPAYKYFEARKQLSEAALREAQRAWRPKLDLWANAYARGSGIAADGAVDKADGWSLSRRNYGAGLQLSFPLLRFSQAGIQKKQYRHLLKADEAQLSQVSTDLQKQLETAQLSYSRQLQIARYAPVQTQAARYAYEGLTLSYQTGLADFTRLTQGQYELLKAELSAAAAYLQAWRSLLDIAVATGNLHLFTDQLNQQP